MTQMDEDSGPVTMCDLYATTRFQAAFPTKDGLGSCVICLDPIEEGSGVTSLLPCEDRQHFHVECINSWLERNATCPTCRKGATIFPFLRRMSDAPLDPNVQYDGLVAICKTASVEGPPSDPSLNVNRLGELGACRYVALAMRAFATERRIQLLGLEAIEALAAHSEQNRTLFDQEGCAALLCQAFAAFPQDRDVQTAACQAVVALATGHQGWQARLGSAGMCGLVCEMLRKWSEDYGAQLAGLYALNALLGKDPDNYQRVFDAGAAAALVHMMRRFWRDIDVLDGAITALCNLSARGEAERRAIGSLEGCKVLLAVMAAHPDARDIQIKCCFTLSKLVLQHPENRHRVLSCRGLLILVRVMDKYRNELAVQIAGAAAIVGLFMPINKSDTSSGGNGTGAGTGGGGGGAGFTSMHAQGLSPCSTDMHHFCMVSAPHTNIQPQLPMPTDEAMATEPVQSYTSNGIPEAFAFNSLVRALATFPGEAELEASCSPALLFLLEVVDGRRALLEDPISAQMFMTALHNYAYDEDSQDLLLEVVILVTDDRQPPRDSLLQAGLASHVLELMGRHTCAVQLLEKCCMVLAALTEESHTNVERVWNAESLARVLGVMASQPGYPALQHFALSCLQTLVEEGGPAQRSLVGPQVLRLACIALAHHWQDEDIRNASLGLLSALASDAGNDGKPYIEAVMRLLGEVWSHCADDPVTRAGVMRWLAVVAHDCSQEELAYLTSACGRALVDEWLTRFEPMDGMNNRLAVLELISAMPQRGQQAWPGACNFVATCLLQLLSVMCASPSALSSTLSTHHTHTHPPSSSSASTSTSSSAVAHVKNHHHHNHHINNLTHNQNRSHSTSHGVFMSGGTMNGYGPHADSINDVDMDSSGSGADGGSGGATSTSHTHTHRFSGGSGGGQTYPPLPTNAAVSLGHHNMPAQACGGEEQSPVQTGTVFAALLALTEGNKDNKRFFKDSDAVKTLVQFCTMPEEQADGMISAAQRVIQTLKSTSSAGSR